MPIEIIKAFVVICGGCKSEMPVAFTEEDAVEFALSREWEFVGPQLMCDVCCSKLGDDLTEALKDRAVYLEEF